MEYKISSIAKHWQAQIILNHKEETIRNVSFDSRTIANGQETLFFALNGHNHSGHDYLMDAYHKGVRNFVVKELKNGPKNANYVIVYEPLRALQSFAKFHREQFHLNVLAITGSNGKTIVKEWLHQLLYKDFSIVRSPKSYNSQIGLPISLLQIQNNHNLALIEAGISTSNEMEFLQEITAPNIGIFTKMGTAHSNGFVNKEEHIKEKFKLFKAVNTLVYSDEDEDIYNYVNQHFRNSNQTVIGFGSRKSSTVQLLEFLQNNHQTNIVFQHHNQSYEYQIPFIDQASLQNSLCVLASLIALGLDFKPYLPKFKELQSVEMRLELKPAKNNSIVINDSFNSDLQSVTIALQLLDQQSKERKIAVLTDLQDSNLPQNDLYQKLAKLVNQYHLDDLILIGEHISDYQSLFQKNSKSYANTQEFLLNLSELTLQNTAILLKGARQFRLEDVAKQLENQTHDTVLEIDLDGIAHNLNYYKQQLNPNTKTMAMVKAFAYGTGDYEVAQTLVQQGVDYLAVAYADEGIALRKAGISVPIMVMNPEQSSYSNMLLYNLEPEIYSFRVLNLLSQELKKTEKREPYPIHIKINTGMNRLGFKPKEMVQLANKIKEYSSFKIVSVFTHLAASDDAKHKAFTQKQIQEYNVAVAILEQFFGQGFIKHVLNSSGIRNYNQYQYNMVRLGIGLYGFSSSATEQKELRNVLNFNTVISQIHNIQAGESVGYGRNFVATKAMKIATLPVGYADGVNRHLGNGKAYVLIHNQAAKIIGNICMDMLMVDVSNIACQEGDKVTILGKTPNVQEWSNTLQTISYEVLTSISNRVKRVYLKG